MNVGCIPTKALVASARAAYMARRGGDFGVAIEGAIDVDMTSHVVPNEVERAVPYVGDVPDTAGQEIVDADDAVPAVERPTLVRFFSRAPLRPTEFPESRGG